MSVADRVKAKYIQTVAYSKDLESFIAALGREIRDMSDYSQSNDNPNMMLIKDLLFINKMATRYYTECLDLIARQCVPESSMAAQIDDLYDSVRKTYDRHRDTVPDDLVLFKTT